MPYRVCMIGAGSFFTDGITRGLCQDEHFHGCTFVLCDIDKKRLEQSMKRNSRIVEQAGDVIKLEHTTDRKRAMADCRYVVTSVEINRVNYWRKDIEIPARHGCIQLKGENGGPGGQAHAMRNITMFMDICGEMAEVCPDAWLMNFTNPMSFLCTYFNKYTSIKSLGFCHQVHGSFGVVAEMLGMEPGELQVITGGVNHFNWLVDIRRRGTGESCKDEFLSRVQKSTYWKKNLPNIPNQSFTLDVLKATGEYMVGYDDHVLEYVPFFYDPQTWSEREIETQLDHLEQYKTRKKSRQKEAEGKSLAREEYYNVPFPKDGDHPYYAEKPTEVMVGLDTNEPHYVDAINIVNHGAIDNLPDDAVVDVPALVVGGAVRGVHVGELPEFGAELCRRQIAIHELLTEATVTGDRRLLMQSMMLDPWVRSIDQARNIVKDFLRAYKKELPQFHK